MRTSFAKGLFFLVGAVFLLTPNQFFHVVCAWTKTSPRVGSRIATSLNVEKRNGKVVGWEGVKKALSKLKQPSSGTEEPPAEKIKIHRKEDLLSYFEDEERLYRDTDGQIDYDKLLNGVVVEGDTQMIGSAERKDLVHPVVQLLHDRRRANETSLLDGQRNDSKKVALAIEGGGMRGCLSAGMVAAIYHLGLEETIDVVYGSSAGTVIGSYFITRQLQWEGPEIYYDSLTTAGKEFIDKKRALRAMGVGLLDPRLMKDVMFRRKMGKPVLNLDYLLKKNVQEDKPLEWDKFLEMQKRQPLKIIASSLEQEKSVVMDLERNSFTSLAEMASCMHASCLLPGIAGQLMHRKKGDTGPDGSKMVIGQNLDPEHYEPMCDALLFEPMPFHSAIAEGATHVIVLRTRPDGTDVTGKSSFFEKLIFQRFFLRKNKLQRIFNYMRRHGHKQRYAEDVLTLNEAAQDQRDYNDLSFPHLLPIAVPPGSPEVSRLEMRREAIFDGVRRGFARAYDALVEDPEQRGKGAEVARQYFPDEILDYDPLEIETTMEEESAFAAYLRSKGEDPNDWKQRAGVGRTEPASVSKK